MRIAVYARVSSDRQEQEETIQSQLAELKARVAEDGLEGALELLDEGYWRDDLIRRDVISSLMCNLEVNKPYIEKKHHIIFDEYFSGALNNLSGLEDDGLVRLSPHSISIPEKARIYVRAICARFDAYLNVSETLSNYSKAI